VTARDYNHLKDLKKVQPRTYQTPTTPLFIHLSLSHSDSDLKSTQQFKSFQTLNLKN